MSEEDAELQKAMAMSLEQPEEDPELKQAMAMSLEEKNVDDMSAQEQDQLTIEQMNSIVASISATSAIGEKVAVKELDAEYAANPMPGFREGIAKLDVKYCAMRRVRKDGNCFYRGFLYRYLEHLVATQNADELKRIQAVIEDAKKKLLSVGYEASAMEMFWEMLTELLDEVPTLNLEQLHKKMNDDDGVSNHIVWFCRALSATQIKLHADRFAPFIMDEFGNTDVDAFCRTQVEPVNHECEQVQIIALTELLEVPVAIEYLDAGGSPSCIIFPDSANPIITLLYRPGHYDILYTSD